MRLACELLLFSLLGYATTIQSVTCSAGQITTKSDSSCSLPHATASVSESGNFGVAAFSIASYDGVGAAYSMTNISRSEAVISDGGARPGFALLSWIVGGTCSPYMSGSCNISLNFDRYGVSSGSRFQPACMGLERCSFSPAMVSITLGSAIVIHSQIMGFSGGDLFSGSMSNQINVGVGFTLYEADGQTPVGWSIAGLSPAPEPGTWIMMLVGVATITIRRIRKICLK